MEMGDEGINSLPSPSEVKGQELINPFKEILKTLDKIEEANPKIDRVSLQDLKEAGLGPMERVIIRTLITSFDVEREYLIENFTEDEIKEKADEVKISIQALRRRIEEENLKWEMEHSNNLYHRYKLLEERKEEFELLRSKVKWVDFSEKRKILVLAHYVMEALKQDTNMVALANLRKPSQFYYLDKRGKVHFNEEAFSGFVKELGIDPEEPISGEELAIILVRRFGYTEESLKGFYEEIVRDLIKPSRMRLPPCIEALAFKPLFYDTRKGKIIDEALSILASWFKYYARGYTTGRIQIGKDKRILLFEFLVSKLYGDIIPVTDQAELVQRFKKFYEEAKPFKCGMVHQFESSFKIGEGILAGSPKICNRKCPFVAPTNRVEEVLASVGEVNLYGADYLEIKIDGVEPFFEPYTPSLSSKSKLVQKFAGFLQSLYKERVEPDKALEILEALLDRVRIVQNYVSELVNVKSGFKEIMEALLEDGALPWDLRAKDKPFLDETGRILFVSSKLIASMLPGIEGLEGYTTSKLIRALKKLPNSPIVGRREGLPVRRSIYPDPDGKKQWTTGDFWMIRVKWLEEHDIEVRVKVPTLEETETRKEPEEPEDLKGLGVNLTPLEKLILEATREPRDITELIELGKGAKKSEDEVTTAVARLVGLRLLEMNDEGKFQRAVGGGAGE